MAPKVKDPKAYAAFLESLIAKHGKGSADPMPAAKKAAILKRAHGTHKKGK